jgi:hypothetical protein
MDIKMANIRGHSALLFANFLVCALAGCASIQPAPQAPIVVSTYGSALSPFIKERPDTGASVSTALSAAFPLLTTYPLMVVRECNKDQTECSTGVVKLASQITVLKVAANSATIHVNVKYDVDRQQVVRDSNMRIAKSIPADVPSLSGKDQFDRVVTLSYGDKRRVSFPHGVDFDVCIAPADKYMQSLDGQCSFEDIARGTTSQSSVQNL